VDQGLVPRIRPLSTALGRPAASLERMGETSAFEAAAALEPPSKQPCTSLKLASTHVSVEATQARRASCLRRAWLTAAAEQPKKRSPGCQSSAAAPENRESLRQWFATARPTPAPAGGAGGWGAPLRSPRRGALGKPPTAERQTFVLTWHPAQPSQLQPARSLIERRGKVSIGE